MNKDTRRKKTLHAFGLIALIVLSSLVVLNFGYVAQAQPIRVACVGDSITFGGYPNLLQEMLGYGYQVRNFGVCGATVSNASKIPYMDQAEFDKALEFDPDIVVIMLGTNDANPEIAYSTENFEADYTQLISAFQALSGKEAIWIAKSPPIFTTDSAYNNTYLSESVLPRINNLSYSLNLPVIDINSACAEYEEYFCDGVHPSSEGAALIAENVCEAITLPDGSPDYTYTESAYYDYQSP